jgi:lysophospholipase L1-like esterase
MRYARYVALGDSSTEGLEDPGMNGRHRGWADRLAKHVANAQGAPLQYANLAIRGRKTRQILEEQLQPALAMRPDLATVFAGTNDVIRSTFNNDAVIADLRTMHRALRATGATVLTITMPDISEIAPLAKKASPRLAAFNAGVRALCAETGALYLDVAADPTAVDKRYWHEDRLHANAEGHRLIAKGLARTLGLPGHEESAKDALSPSSPESPLSRAISELRWVQGYLLPWLVRHALGRSSGDGITPKYPRLVPVLPD